MVFILDSSENKSGATPAVASLDDAALSIGLSWAEANGPANRQGDTRFYAVWGKRLFDLTVGSLMLLALAPLLLILMLIVAIDGGQPIFAHSRVGQNGKRFNCLKIRSMRHGADQQLAMILASDPGAAAEWAADHKLSNDSRVTRIGVFLRKSSIDELPQLINVLRGEMSLVGPRPVTAGELERYGPVLSSYLTMKPGLTGPWQVDGRNDLSYEGRVALDVDYAWNYSFWRDLGIVFRTGLSVLRLTGK